MPIRIFLTILLGLGFAGCATTKNKTDHDQLQSRVVDLEKKLEEKDSEIVDLQYEIKDLSSKVENKNIKFASEEPETSLETTMASTKGPEGLIKVNTTVEKVQSALKNAGYYTGRVDGKAGPGTKAAIVAFQKSQGLKADGVVGRKTWDLLKQNLQ